MGHLCPIQSVVLILLKKEGFHRNPPFPKSSSNYFNLLSIYTYTVPRQSDGLPPLDARGVINKGIKGGFSHLHTHSKVAVVYSYSHLISHCQLYNS